MAPTDERRVVTVLFGDIVGFTALAETLDPEQVKNLVDRCFDRLAEDIRSFGGSVDKVIGDAVVALFGAPVAHEDDAERAVRAGLQMQRTLAEIAPSMVPDVRMRIGINTGEVLVGSIRACGDYTAMGDVVNTASRLQTIAEPGQVVVGAETHAATAEVIRYEPLGLLQARGREAAVEAWVAEEALTLPGRRVPRRTSSRLVGREAEVDLLRNVFQTAFRHRRPTLVVLTGEAGVGKSRLGEEVVLQVMATGNVRVLSGRAVPYGQANAWAPIAEVLRAACGITPDDTADAVREKTLVAVAAALSEATTSEEVVRVSDALQYLIGVDTTRLTEVDRKRAQDEISRGVRVFLEGLAARQPLIITIGDVHWADPAVLAGLDALLGRVRRVPLVVLLTARPELAAVWRPSAPHQNLVALNLDPLDADAAVELLAALIGRDPGPEVTDGLIERSGGNPLFVEELAALLLERTADVGGLPATLRGVVAARLDALPAELRGLLDDTAVLGRRSPIAAVTALAATRGVTGSVESIIDELVDRDVLLVDGAQVEYRSDLVREVVYGTLTKAERARRHAAVARWIESAASELDRSDEAMGELARHYGTAAELVAELGPVPGVPDDIHDLAVGALERAADRAENRELHLVAFRLFDQLFRVLGDEPSDRRRHALVGRARAATALHRDETAAADLDRVEAEAREAGDLLALARALTVRGDLLRNIGRYEESIATLETALAHWREVGDRRGEGSALRRLGWTLLFAGDIAAAEPFLKQALDAFEEAGALRGQAWAHQNLAWTAYGRGDAATAEERLHDSLALFKEIGDWGGIAWATGMLAHVRFGQGRTAEAEELATRARAEASEQGDRWQLGMMTVLLGSIRLWQGRTEDAVERYREAQEVFAQIGDAWGWMQAAAPMARALLLAGRREDAERLAAEAEARAEVEGLSNYRVFAEVARTSNAVAAGEPEEAFAALSDISAEPGDARWAAIELLVNRSLALVQSGRPGEALELLEVSATIVTDVGPRGNVLGALALARAAAGKRVEAVAAADEMLALDGGTYADRLLAHMTRACVAAADGRVEQARWEVDTGERQAAMTQDRVAQAVASVARAVVGETLDDPFAAGARQEAVRRGDELGLSLRGWWTAFGLAAGWVNPSEAASDGGRGRGRRGRHAARPG